MSTGTAMTQALQALTEKEKETLRLLVNGYDAKSMARHLGLSVHTVNERLRDARRKLATSSSREAARMLREAERAPPQLLGDKALGDASSPETIDTFAHQDRAGTSWRRQGWIIGGFVMSFALALYALSALSGTAQAPAQAPAQAAAEHASVGAARAWLALVDKKDWEASWAATASSFRQANSLERWSAAGQAAHGPLGAALSRELVTADYSPAPPSGVWTVRFRARFANQREATETLALHFEAGAWRVVGVILD